LSHFNGAITFKDVWESHPVFEQIIMDIYNDEMEQQDSSNKKAAVQNTINKLRGK